MKIYIQGLLLGLAYVAPIGMQNLYVIQSALQGLKKQTFFTTFFIILNDISLAFACYFGVGNLLLKFPRIQLPLIIGGLFVMLYIAFSLWNKDIESFKTTKKLPLKVTSILATCFAVTWFNPQAIIDGTILFGGIRSSLPLNGDWFFILGFSSASIMWFTTITIIVTLTKKSFTPNFQLLLNKICALILVLFSIRLFLKFII
ncbi:LysE family transporter [Clostridium sp. 'deep sea']|uniref:LysE/ArgO family amino acid transporter n=1 Tax=Clostridium sp. 'deep sea' TaxID=2779445 RepID=UPI0018969820|nr:LysE family transporter [Clostridium sp. 'deep sea']QOR36128.1 LysE family transporter [Clostridium sp. 'deep sea']